MIMSVLIYKTTQHNIQDVANLGGKIGYYVEVYTSQKVHCDNKSVMDVKCSLFGESKECVQNYIWRIF